jgi:alcohol-forming fatty acyl-CoA reductase
MSEMHIRSGRIAAIFDIDGTLLPAPSLELRLLAHLARQRELRVSAIGRWLSSVVAQFVMTPDGGDASPVHRPILDENKRYLAGVRVGVAEEWIGRRIVALEFFTDALATLAWHRNRGHAIVFVSGTLAPLARAVGSFLTEGGGSLVCATELETERGRWTGRISGEAICGRAKERALNRLAAEQQFDLSRSYAYADSLADQWSLAAVGHPVAVNATPLLARHARRNGWRLSYWHERRCVNVRVKRGASSGAENSAPTSLEKLVW